MTPCLSPKLTIAEQTNILYLETPPRLVEMFTIQWAQKTNEEKSWWTSTKLKTTRDATTRIRSDVHLMTQDSFLRRCAISVVRSAIRRTFWYVLCVQRVITYFVYSCQPKTSISPTGSASTANHAKFVVKPHMRRTCHFAMFVIVLTTPSAYSPKLLTFPNHGSANIASSVKIVAPISFTTKKMSRTA